MGAWQTCSGSGEATLRSSDAVVCVEFWPEGLRRAGSAPSELFRFVRASAWSSTRAASARARRARIPFHRLGGPRHELREPARGARRAARRLGPFGRGQYLPNPGFSGYQGPVPKLQEVRDPSAGNEPSRPTAIPGSRAPQTPTFQHRHEKNRPTRTSSLIGPPRPRARRRGRLPAGRIRRRAALQHHGLEV